ncbi:964_t:CDS:2 [Entrophospora sp. SA101]|nr:964_t:CDS:2 [Entrophospora sp. SA101]CAJ0845041.1 16420_t:CDS:2 [Entrophospora sp. SA101]
MDNNIDIIKNEKQIATSSNSLTDIFDTTNNTNTPRINTDSIIIDNIDNTQISPADSTSKTLTPTSKALTPFTSTVDNTSRQISSVSTIADAVESSRQPFPFAPYLLSPLFDPKNLRLLKIFGGTDGIIKGLHTNIETGLSSDEMAPLNEISLDEISDIANEDDTEYLERIKSKKSTAAPIIITGQQPVDSSPFYQRKMAFGTNVLPERKPKSIFMLMWMAFQEKILILLTIAATISLGLGLYEDLRPTADPSEPKVSWVEGVAIIVAIMIVVLVGSINDWQKERQFQKLNAKKEDRYVKATRNGKEFLLSVHDILVGDILHLEPGDIIAADGILVSGHNLRCDESAATGESDAVKKIKYENINNQLSSGSTSNQPHLNTTHIKADPFIISGSKVIEGVGSYVVTCVGANSYHGRTMMSLRSEPEDTPLQIKLNDLAEKIAKLGGAAALLMLMVLLIEYFVKFRNGAPGPASEILESLTTIFISAVTVVVVAVPEGLPLAVTLALAYATTRMLKDNNLVRVLAACETMGNATIICSDKTGTLTQNKMTVVAGTIGLSKSFVRVVDVTRRNSPSQKIPKTLENPILLKDLAKELPADSLKLLEESIAINSTAFEGEKLEDGKINFVGSKTDTALLGLLFDLNLENYKSLRESAKIQQLYPFSSERKAMGIVVKLKNNKFRFLVKGASEVLLKKATKTIESTDKLAFDSNADVVDLSEEDNKTLHKIIDHYAGQSLRTIALAYRDFDEWPPKNTVVDEGGEVKFEDLAENVTLIGIMGIEDPLRVGVREAVLDCKKAGVRVCMVTGDNLLTAKSIAAQCDIYTNGKIMEGPVFRDLSPEEMDNVIPRLQVLARSSPEDKKILVSRLREMGEVVAVTGDGTNDGPALKAADVGFSMGIAGTEVAKEASSIILMDDNFASIVKAIMWGRCVNDSVKKFLQFQLTVNVTAVVLTFVSAVSSDSQESVLTAVQLLWVNLIMDTLAALALATDPPTPELLDRDPEPKTAPLITFDMWKMILGQSLFQLVVTFILLYAGNNILNYDDLVDKDAAKLRLDTVIFNTFVFLQIFNELNCRRLNHKLNIFKNITANKFLIVIFFITVVGQILIVEFGSVAFHTTHLNIYEWLLCIIVGFMSIPFGVVIRLIPNEFFMCYIKPDNTKTVASINRNSMYSPHTLVGADQKEWNDAVLKVQNQLGVFKALRGGRFKAHFGDRKEKQVTRSNAFAAATMVPSLISASVGAGWAPIQIIDNGNGGREPSITQLDLASLRSRSRNQSFQDSRNGSPRSNSFAKSSTSNNGAGLDNV